MIGNNKYTHGARQLDALVFYDYLQVNGGAERVFSHFLQLFESVEGVVHYIDKNYATEEVGQKIVKVLSEHAPHRYLSHFATPLRFSSIRPDFFPPSKVNIYSGLYSPLQVSRSKAERNFYYCHTPPRHWYDMAKYYQENERRSVNCLIGLQKCWLESQYKSSLLRMDKVICNSENVRGRLLRYLGIDSVVVYPPCDIAKYHWQPSQGYYLSLARLENYKRIEDIVRTFCDMPDKKLVVASGGSLLEPMRQLVQEKNVSNISFTGWVDEQSLTTLIENCIATIYLPIDEDFGMSPVESMAAGKPVIGIKEGGVMETIQHEQTGLLLEPECVREQLIAAISTMNEVNAEQMRHACTIRASHFSVESFERNIKSIVWT